MREKKRSVFGFHKFGEGVQRLNRKALWQVLRVYDVGLNPLSVSKSMYDDSSACVRVKWGESERFRIDSGGRRVYHVSLAVQVQCMYG